MVSKTFRIDSLRINVRYVHFSNSSLSATKLPLFQIPSKKSWQHSLAKLVKPWLVSCRNRKILKQLSQKKNYWAFKSFSKTPFVWSFPICQEALDISQIATAFHGICPPILIQARLQQYCRCTFFHSAHRSLSNTIRLGSMTC